ncbi:MAG: hypothetical protein R3D29_07345 [Nitratireductor sp.]
MAISGLPKMPTRITATTIITATAATPQTEPLVLFSIISSSTELHPVRLAGFVRSRLDDVADLLIQLVRKRKSGINVADFEWLPCNWHMLIVFSMGYAKLICIAKGLTYSIGRNLVAAQHFFPIRQFEISNEFRLHHHPCFWRRSALLEVGISRQNPGNPADCGAFFARAAKSGNAMSCRM